MNWTLIRNLALLATGAAGGHFVGRLFSEADFTREQEYVRSKGLLLDLDDDRGFTLWTEVPGLGAARPTDQVFVIDSVAGEIVFGDGVHGRRPPWNSGTVKAKYRRRPES